MPSLIGSLFVSLTADFAPFQRNMKQAEGITASTSAGMRRNVGLTERSVNSLQRTMGSNIRPYALISAARTFETTAQRANLLRGALFATTAAFGGLGAALTSNIVSRYLDTFVNISNQLRAVSADTGEVAGKFETLSAVADRSRSSLAAVALLYTRLQRASPDESTDKIARRVETINKGLQLGGATAQEAASAAIQFSQAIQSNRLGGDELRAVLETPLGGELAKGLGVTIGKLRQLSKEGKLTADILFKALDKISGDVDKKFANSVATIDQALTLADNAIIAYAGSLNSAYGITKAITSGIGSFADNLDTIIPLLATVGGLLGANFAARLITGFAGAKVTSLVDGMRAVTNARKDDLRFAKEQFALAEKSRADALTALGGARGQVAGDVRGLAPKADLKAYQRDLAAIQKADANHLDLLARKVQVVDQLANVSKSLTVAEVKAADTLAASQTKLNGLYAEQTRIRRDANRASAAVSTSGTGLKTQFADQATAQKALNALKKEQTAIDRAVSKEEGVLSKQREGYVKAYNASFLAAAEQRAAVLVTEKALVQELAASEAARAKLAATARVSGGTVQTAGLATAKTALADAEKASLGANAAIFRAGQSLVIAEKAAGRFAIALAGIRSAGAGLVGFLGGPWGVALTAAIATMTLLGIRSREAAEKVANAERIISENLGEMAKAGNQNALREVLTDELKARTDELTAVLDHLQTQRKAVADAVNIFVGSLFDTGIVTAEVAGQMTDLSARFRDGTASVADLTKGLDGLGVRRGAELDGIIQSAVETKDKMDRAAGAVDNIKAKIADLDGRIAVVTVDVHYVDRARNLDEARDQRNIDDREQYAAGQRSLRDAVELARKRKEILDAAGEGKVKNTSGAIDAREQELLEQGYAKTRESARALATEELNLKESTREAGKGASAAAKEYEKFANKLAELQATASGAFLSDLDQKTVDFARSLKNGSEMMKQYIAAVNSGDLTLAPKQLIQAREALMQIGAADTWRSIIQQYGTGAQLAGTFADKQAELNYLVSEGKITAGQAGAAYADFISQFGNYQWVNDLSSALTDFAGKAVTDFDNIGASALDLLKQIAQITLQMTLLGPLEEYLKGGFAGAATGGSGGGVLSTIFGSLFGGGGGAGGGTPSFAGPWGAGYIPGFAGGTRSAPGGMSWVGEHGKELMNVPPGSQIMPASESARAMGAISGGGRSTVELRLSPDLEARILNQASQQSVQITKSGIKSYDKSALPGSAQRVQRDRRAR